MANKLLLTTVVRPFGGPGEGDSVGAELFHAQVTRAQGPFSLRQVIRCWAIDYLAENVEVPTVTLHYPSLEELESELAAGDYSHVGINFVVATFHKVPAMVAMIRRVAPRAKVILGGYGTVLPDEILRPHGDAICREEGIGFLRRLFGEKVDAPMRHPHAPIPSVQVCGYQQPTVVGHVTAGLGCPNGCDFCCTSHFFDRKYVPLATSGRDVYEALMATRARAAADGAQMKSYIVIDEDFFLHHSRARQFLECVREGGEPLSVMGFGSVRGLSRFTPREIAEMGFDLVWSAFEGKKSGYRKLEGTPLPELYRGLNSVGTSLLTSMIIGFPYQDEATIRAEFEQLMALEPTMVQCLIYFAFPGTPFHEQVIREGRYLPRYRNAPDLRRWDGFAMHFEHPHFDGPEPLEALQRNLYRSDFARLGPTVLRFARVQLTGYETLRDDESPLLRARAEQLRMSARNALPTLLGAALWAPSRDARERAMALRRDIVRLTGSLTAAERAKETALPALWLVERAAEKLGVFQQPGLLRTAHRMPGAAESQATSSVFRLQGGRFASPLRALAEDAVEVVRRLRTRKSPPKMPVPTGAATMPAASQRPCSVIDGDCAEQAGSPAVRLEVVAGA